MTLEDIIKIADDNYPGGRIREYFELKQAGDPDTVDTGIGVLPRTDRDMMAELIVNTITYTYKEWDSDEDQLSIAGQQVAKARLSLHRVEDALVEAHRLSTTERR